jgi:cation diffusion facilitator CzcD-associated flavoprotein CzcO
VSAVGGLHLPSYPRISGSDRFQGDAFHTARWRHDVELVTTRIERMTRDGIVTADDKTRQVDVIVYATGFRPFDPSAEITIRGRDGRLLSDEWQDGPQAFRGVAVTGFPNYFLPARPREPAVPLQTPLRRAA